MNILFAVASAVPGASTNRAISASFDDGQTFTPIITPASESYCGGAVSVERGEILFLTTAGVIQRTVDGITVAPLVNDIGNGAWKDIQRDDTLGLYVAVGSDGVDTTHRISTSPDGVTWTRRSAPALNYAAAGAFPNIMLAGSATFAAQPMSQAADGITWALTTAFGFSADISAIAQDSAGGFMFGSPGDLRSVSANAALSSFSAIFIPGGQLCMGYDPVTDLYATGDPAQGVWTSPASAPVWTLRASGLHYLNATSMVAKPDGGFIGLRPVSGSETLHRILSTDDGITWTQTAPANLFADSTYRKLVSFSTSPIIVPDIVGMLLVDAIATLEAAGFTVGTIAEQPTNAFANTTVLSQFPLGGSEVAALGSVDVSIAVPDPRIVPNVIGMTLAEAEIAIRAAGFLVGTTSVTTEPLGPLGTVVFQTPPGGSIAEPGTKIALVSTALLVPFDVDATVISQYSNSPTINRLVENMAEYVDPAVSMTDFYNLIWNVDTAVGFGLDIWGDIVGVSRLLRLPSTDPVFGFINEDDPPDWQTFNSGIFFPGDAASQAYLLPDDSFRTLILTKALSNIVATSAASLNALLRNLFPGRGKSYVVDLGGMAMRFVFEFVLTTTEYAILTQSGALPHPAGVSYSVVVVATETFGFSEAGPTALPFDFGVYYLPPA